MNKLIIIILLIGAAMASAAVAEKMTGLPSPDDVFVIATSPHSGVVKDYFTPDSLLEALPKLVPANVLLPAGDKIFWQSGVIVLQNKTVLFWRTCGDWFIAIDTPNGTTFYAIEKESSQQSVPGYPPQGVGSPEP